LCFFLNGRFARLFHSHQEFTFSAPLVPDRKLCSGFPFALCSATSSNRAPRSEFSSFFGWRASLCLLFFPWRRILLVDSLPLPSSVTPLFFSPVYLHCYSELTSFAAVHSLSRLAMTFLKDGDRRLISIFPDGVNVLFFFSIVRHPHLASADVRACLRLLSSRKDSLPSLSCDLVAFFCLTLLGKARLSQVPSRLWTLL